MAVEMFIYFKDKQCSLDGFALPLLCHQQGDVQDHHHYHLAHMQVPIIKIIVQ